MCTVNNVVRLISAPVRFCVVNVMLGLDRRDSTNTERDALPLAKTGNTQLPSLSHILSHTHTHTHTHTHRHAHASNCIFEIHNLSLDIFQLSESNYCSVIESTGGEHWEVEHPERWRGFSEKQKHWRSDRSRQEGLLLKKHLHSWDSDPLNPCDVERSGFTPLPMCTRAGVGSGEWRPHRTTVKAPMKSNTLCALKTSSLWATGLILTYFWKDKQDVVYSTQSW